MVGVGAMVAVALMVGVGAVVGVALMVAVGVALVVAVAVSVAVEDAVPVAVGAWVGVAVNVAVAVPVGVGVAVEVGVGEAVIGTSKTACAVSTGVPRRKLAIARKVGDAVPLGGAARSPNARVKPSLVDMMFKRVFIAPGSAMVGAELLCEP